jgi:transposase-like protein
MRHAPEVIVRAVHQHADGFSLSKVQNHLWQHDNIQVTRESVSNWVRKYGVFLKSDKRKRQTHNQRAHSHG